jgi:prepilin-type N-terminal cleavage/methylation domain-containing protein
VEILMRRKTDGFTLIELMVAISLGLVVMGMVGYAFHSTSNASSKALAVVNAQQKAMMVLRIFETHFSSSIPAEDIVIGKLKEEGGFNEAAGENNLDTSVLFLATVSNLDNDGDGKFKETPYTDAEDLYKNERTHDLAWIRYVFDYDHTDAETGYKYFTLRMRVEGRDSDDNPNTMNDLMVEDNANPPTGYTNVEEDHSDDPEIVMTNIRRDVDSGGVDIPFIQFLDRYGVVAIDTLGKTNDPKNDGSLGVNRPSFVKISFVIKEGSYEQKVCKVFALPGGRFN